MNIGQEVFLHFLQTAANFWWRGLWVLRILIVRISFLEWGFLATSIVFSEKIFLTIRKFSDRLKFKEGMVQLSFVLSRCFCQWWMRCCSWPRRIALWSCVPVLERRTGRSICSAKRHSVILHYWWKLVLGASRPAAGHCDFVPVLELFKSSCGGEGGSQVKEMRNKTLIRLWEGRVVPLSSKIFDLWSEMGVLL